MTREEAIEYFKMKVSAREAIGNDIGTDYEAYKIALSALRPVSREQVEKIRGEWVEEDDDLYCSRCGHIIPDCAGNATPIYKSENKFCYYCGAPMTDEAVQMVMERLEALKDGKGV